MVGDQNVAFGNVPELLLPFDGEDDLLFRNENSDSTSESFTNTLSDVSQSSPSFDAQSPPLNLQSPPLNLESPQEFNYKHPQDSITEEPSILNSFLRKIVCLQKAKAAKERRMKRMAILRMKRMCGKISFDSSLRYEKKKRR